MASGHLYVQILMGRGPSPRSPDANPYDHDMSTRAAVYGRQSSGKEKSIDEQLLAGHLVIDQEGWEHAGDYQDGKSASRFGTKVRGGWAEVMNSVANSDSIDVLILWESSRGDRTPETWFAFLSACRTSNVRIHVITHDRTYNLSNGRDWKTLAEDGVNNAYESEVISVRTRRGHAGAAVKGLPPGGPTPFGYRRTFDPATGKRLGQVPDTAQAVLVQHLFSGVSNGEPLTAIANRLNATETRWGVWTPSRIRRMVHNRSYVALRTHNGIEHQGQWEPIVDEAVYYAALKVISDPARRKTRPGRQKHLLTYLGSCGVCGTFLEYAAGYYRCSSVKHCVSMPKDVADTAIRAHVIGRLKQPDALKALQDSDDKDIQRAENEVVSLKRELADWRNKAAKRLVTAESFIAIEPGLLEGIQEAEQRAHTLAVPLVLREMLAGVGEIDTRWDSATVVAQRTVIKALAEIRVGRGKPGRTNRSTYKRLGPSRWHGDTRTWAELWAGL